MRARIMVAVVFVPLLFIIMFYLPVYAMGVTVGVISAVAVYELLGATKTANTGRLGIYPILSAILIPVLACFENFAVTGIFVILLLLAVLFVEAILAYKTPQPVTLEQIVMSMFAGGILPLFLSSLVLLRAMDNGRLYVVIPFVIAFLSDAGAYFVGLKFGRHKLIPKVSPKKTIEGSIGGFAVAILAMIILCVVLNLTMDFSISVPLAILYGIFGSAICQLGDLAFSLIKREYNIKDFGNLLPGHGGMLDRFDSMVFVAPLVCFLVTWLPVFYS